MTRDEITSLLEMLVANYPNTKIRDPKATADAWEMTLGMYQAESVFKAARYHMDTSSFFPTPADIKKKMVKAKLIYDEPHPSQYQTRRSWNTSMRSASGSASGQRKMTRH